MPYFATSLTSLGRAAMLAYENSNIYKFNHFPAPDISQALSSQFSSAGYLQGAAPHVMPPGFEFIAEDYQPDHNYYGIAMRNTATGEIVIANRGTEGSPIDIAMNKAIAKGDVPLSAGDALAFAADIAGRPEYANATIINVGDSKGAYEGAYASAKLTDLAIGSKIGRAHV